VLLQADVNDNEADDEHHEPALASSPLKSDSPDLLTSEQETPQKLYPSAPRLDESDESTASAHSTEV